MLAVIQAQAQVASKAPLLNPNKKIVSADDIVHQALQRQGGVEENHQAHPEGIIGEDATLVAGHMKDAAELPH